jgi:hypothetical protein
LAWKAVIVAVIAPRHKLPAWATDSSWNIPVSLLLSFSGIGLYPRRQEDKNFPSWLPNLEVLGKQIRLSSDDAYRIDTLDANIPQQYRPSVSRISGLTCFGVQVSLVCEIVTRSPKISNDFEKDYRQQSLEAMNDLIENRCNLLNFLLHYFIAEKGRLWSASYPFGGSWFQAFVETIIGCFRQGMHPISPEVISSCSLEEFFRIARQQSTMMDGPDVFSESELKLLGFSAEEQLWDCLSIVPKYENRGDSTPIPTGDLASEPQRIEQPKEFVSQLASIMTEKCIFQKTNRLIGAGPPGMEANDLVYLIHGLAMPLLLRKADGKLVNVGVCYISGISRISRAESVQFLLNRESDICKVEIVS